ncbi:PAS domain-containing protein [Pelosinus sp. sgz500959]|uniref:PAS domain-containing protein n=1 Tax=Pelosinus sp. sgz500959 TaxID=3242472 RepID=UPI00366E9443
MSSVGAIDNVEELLVIRIDHQSTIVQVLYYAEQNDRLVKKIIGKKLQNVGLEQTIYKQCEDHLKKVFVNLKKEIFQVHIGNRYYQISYLPEWNGREQVENVLTIVRDITKEQNVQEELMLSQVKIQMAQQIALLGYFDRDIVNDKLYWSDQFYKNFNLVPQEKPPSLEFLLTLIHPEDREMIKRGFFQRPEEEVLDVEYRIINKDGSIGWIHSLVHSVFDDNGKLLKKFGIVQDITKRKAGEIKLQELTEQLQQANKSLTDREMRIHMAGKIAKLGYFEWDKTNHSLYWSDQQYRNYGYTPSEVTPTIELFRSHIHHEDWDFVQTTVAKLDEKPWIDLQFRVIRADGSLAWLYSRINKINNDEGCLIKLFGINQDITEQKQAVERIHKVEKELAFMNQLHSRSTYLNGLLFNDCSVEQIIKALNEFGIETQVAHCCFVVRLAEKLSYNTEVPDKTMPPSVVRKQAVLIWLAEREWGLVWRCHDDIVILTSISDCIATNKQGQSQIANDIIAEIEKVFPHFYVNVGISGLSSIPVNFREIYEKAQRAVVIAATMDSSSVIHCDDIGLYEIAFQLLQDKNTCTMVQNTIGRLAEHDEDRGSNLLITLEAILEYGSLKAVARQLFIHNNTVIWRKQKIEMFLGMSLDKMETRSLLLLYLKIWNIKRKTIYSQ